MVGKIMRESALALPPPPLYYGVHRLYRCPRPSSVILSVAKNLYRVPRVATASLPALQGGGALPPTGGGAEVCKIPSKKRGGSAAGGDGVCILLHSL